MKLFLQATLCFAFVAAVFGQGGYGRRQRRPRVHRPPIVQKPPYTTGGFDPIEDPFGNGLDSLSGRGFRRRMPAHIRKIIGSTISGKSITGGMDGFPRHGGTLNRDGIVNGWGDNPNEPVIPAVAMWSDPLNGAAFPKDYRGQDLVLDKKLNRYISKKDSSVGHQIAKESHVAVGRGFVGALVDQVGHGTVNAGHVAIDDPRVIAHNIGVATLGADAVAGHNIAKASGSPVGIGFINPRGPVATQMGHDIAKSTGVFGADPFAKESHVALKNGGVITGGVPSSHNTVKAEHNIVKEATHIERKTMGTVGGFVNPIGVDPISHNIDKQIISGMGGFGRGSVGALVDQVGHGTVNAGHVAIDDPRVIAHNIGVATLGADAVAGHNIAKASGSPVGIGFINPGGPVATQMGHDIAKSTGMIGADPFGVGIDPFGQVSHGTIKASSGRHIGVSEIGTVNAGHVGVNAHDVHKSLGTDTMVGHNIAKASGIPGSVGFINHGGSVASQMGHDIAKTTGAIALDPFDTIGHDTGRGTSGVGMHQVGIVGKTSDPVHNIDKVGLSGLASIGHDPLAASLGHGIAKQAIGEAAEVVNMGSRGGVSAGDPIAIAATHGLVKESLRVADNTINMASSGIVGGRRIGAGMDIFGQDTGVAGGRRVGAGMGVFGHNSMVHPKPVKKPPPKFPTGYGRRTH